MGAFGVILTGQAENPVEAPGGNEPKEVTNKSKKQTFIRSPLLALFVTATLGVMLGLVVFGVLYFSTDMAESNSLYEGSNKFASDLYEAVKGQHKNLVCSPISLQIVLAMAYAGAGGKTAEQMAKVLHLPGDLETTNKAHKSLIESLKDPVLKVANKIYLDDRFQVKDQYKQMVQTYFMSEVARVPFGKDSNKAAKDINSWVENNTNNKIKDLISPDSIDSMTRMVLVNAIHFKADWKFKFNEQFTKDAPFHVSNQKQVQVKMMFNNANYRYGDIPELDAKVLEMPYAGDKFRMIIILPNEIEGLRAVEKKLATMQLSSILSKLYSTNVEVKLPRFKIESTLDLGETLKKMGMTALFDSTANLSNLSDENLYVSKVIQKAFIEVNEEGTEAAAASGVQMLAYSLPVRKPFKADHPFFYILQHIPSDLIIFKGNFMDIS